MFPVKSPLTPLLEKGGNLKIFVGNHLKSHPRISFFISCPGTLCYNWRKSYPKIFSPGFVMVSNFAIDPCIVLRYHMPTVFIRWHVCMLQ